MSFGKAKIKRFNDIKELVAAPISVSKNNIRENIKLTNRTPANSDYSSEAGSVKSTPCFRTPTVIRKKKHVGIPPALKSNSVSKENLELEALKEKIVECENKDASINDLRDQIEELKDKISLLEKHKLQLISDKENFERALFLQKFEHSKLLQKMMDEFEEGMIVNRIKKTQLKDDVSLLKTEINSLKEDHRRDIVKLKNDCVKVQEACQLLIEEQSKVLETKNRELMIKEKELKVYKEECMALQREYTFKSEEMTKAHQLEIQDIEFDFLKTMTELQNEKDVLLRQIREVEEKAKGKIEQMSHLFHNEKLVVLNESEQKIKEVQEMMKRSFEAEMNMKIKELENAFENSWKVQQNENRLTLEEERRKKEKVIQAILKEKSSYEISIKTYQKTIEVIKNRLISSDRNTEQLKDELSSCEKTLLEYEEKCLQLCSDLQQAQKFNEDLEMQFESTIKLNRIEIESLKKDLCQKLQLYKEQVGLYSQQMHANEINKEELIKLRNEVGRLREQSEEEKTIFAKYIQISGRYDDILQRYEVLQNENIEKDKVITNLSDNLKEFSNLQEKYNEQVEMVNEMLKKIESTETMAKDASIQNNLSSVEEERNSLLSKVQYLEGELKDLNTKYVDLAGHHNNKQRIKHLSDLKQKNEDILQQNLDLAHRLQTQKEETERLKKENSDLKKCLKKQKYRSEDKENIGSPRSLNSSRVESPFRERN